MNLFFIPILNFSLVLISILLMIKSSDIPFIFPENWTFLKEFWGKFETGNTEAFTLSSSVIASYIFYFVNVFIPNIIKRKDILPQISPQVTQVVYRTMCLIYIHKNLSDKLEKPELTEIYKIIVHDIDKKTNLIPWFSDILTTKERNAIHTFQSSKDKFLMHHRKLDEVCKTLSLAAISLTQSIKLPSSHANDDIWFRVDNKEISFIKDSNTFMLFMYEISEYNKKIAEKIPDMKLLTEFLMQTILKEIQKNQSQNSGAGTS